MTARLGATRAVVFSGYGTVFDGAGAVMRAQDALGEKAAPLAALWQAKRFEYAWLSTITGRRIEMWEITGEALDHALAALGFGRNALLRARLMQGQLQAPPFPDIRPVLEALRRERTRQIGLLSNASVTMLTAAVKAGELYPLFDALISAEPTGLFKPAPEVYALAPARFGLAPGEIAYVSAHPWDVAGAAAAGLAAIWLNRDGARAEFAWAPPAETIAAPDALPALLAGPAEAA
ncbi:haloacid dehalogenase type II [Elioraea sp. Yellowstone]|jgi:2-haloacid dehalogenase|uniref:haloacid dehalogenase type II n=1 Tax=Elioraea sp. Yellowstone TaxID=2592070 RepID=UPI00114E2073|nr:haloacid dehalogenase type II [Elioraea sp. Yellowstone]TQF77659.1 haloacid dehalogenase type II [Elioraea sp. Yellowstone]